MVTAAPKPKDNGSATKKPNRQFDPDQYRMTIGDHLEELRRRFVWALIGYGLVLTACLFYGDQVVAAFCQPLVEVLDKKGINSQLVIDEVGEGFMVFIQISMISAAAIASPWIAWQIWGFVAAGLFPHERKYVTKFLPVSISLMVGGMLFMYFFVLPWTLEFLVDFTVGIPAMGQGGSGAPALVESSGRLNIPIFKGNPEQAANGDLWFDTERNQMKILVNGLVRVISIRSENLIAPEIKLSTYIDMVVSMLLIFGLSFQLPLVVLAVVRIGIVELDSLKKARQIVYFILVILAAVITPGGDIPTMLMLAAPLCGLYELGLWLAKPIKPKPAAA